MKAHVSLSGGVCAFHGPRKPSYVDLNRMRPLASESIHLVYGALRDWELVEGKTKESILELARKRQDRLRIVANVEACLLGLSDPLTTSLMEESEELMAASGGRDEVVAALLRAPLARIQLLQELAERALASGFGALGGVLDEVRELQPTLQRVVDRWLALPEALFAPTGSARTHVWSLAVQRRIVFKTLTAASLDEVQSAWSSLLFEGSQPGERRAFGAIARRFAQALFPGSVTSSRAADEECRESDDFDDGHALPYSRSERKRREGGHRSYERALKQVDAITSAVARGQDAKARKFLLELIAKQVRQGENEYAVKSLCNVAQRCAEMFRTDFEYECLKQAMSLSPLDGYLLIQLADHFKRVGRFTDALDVLESASGLGQDDVRLASIADVYTTMRDFEAALRIYERLEAENWSERVRQAKADVLRKAGRLDAAKDEYTKLVDEGYGEPRVIVGLAEVAKKQGRLEEAKALYESVAAGPSVPERDLVIYGAALANVLVRIGSFAEAYQYLDEVVQLRPFAFHLRAQRAAVAGLLGHAEDAIKDLPDLGQTRAFDEWVNAYVRGLLLLMLKRYADARRALVAQIGAGFLDAESETVVRLGAAVSFLRTRAGLAEASELLEESDSIGDAFASVVHTALRYHVAVARGRRREVDTLRAQLEQVSDAGVASIVKAIDSRAWGQAWQLEIQAVLRLAA